MGHFILIIFALGTLCASVTGRARLIGGYPIDIKEVPHQASLETPDYECGAVILSKEWIMTAGHCCEYPNAAGYTIRVGSNKRDEGGVPRDVDIIYQHPDFDIDTLQYDVCVLHLEENLTLNNVNIKAATIVSAFPTNTQATLSGWGYTDTMGHEPSTLQGGKVNITTKQLNALEAILAPILNLLGINIASNVNQQGTQFTITDNTVLVCNGDSGSAMVDSNRNIIGIIIASTTETCAPNSENVYTNVVQKDIRDFIRSKTTI